jgi:hypothetical protein
MQQRRRLARLRGWRRPLVRQPGWRRQRRLV